MKKSLFAGIVAVAVLLAIPTVAFAAFNAQGVVGSYADRSGCPSVACSSYVDKNADGVCDNCNAANGSCPNYRDADGDGVCDRAGTGCPRGYACPNPGNGRALGADQGNAGNASRPNCLAGTCSGYVDENTDGVCDNCNAANGDCPNYCADAVGGSNCPSGTCPGYVDENADGVCDNCDAANGSCPNYRDADGDGVCDRAGTGCRIGSAYGQHGHHGHGCRR